jgi:hypothetical protein
MPEEDVLIRESLYDSRGRAETLITLLVEFSHVLSACLRSRPPENDSPFSEETTIDDPLQIDPYGQIGKSILKLAERPGLHGPIVIRVKGLSSVERYQSSKPDYEVLFSDVVMDRHSVARMTRRKGDRLAYLEALMSKAFDVLAAHDIVSFYLRLPENTPEALGRVRYAVAMLAQYKSALERDVEIQVPEQGRRMATAIMRDEKGQPDVNLTLLAGLNRISVEAMGNLVKEVREWIQQSDTSAGAHRYASVYNAISDVKNLGAKLIKPPLEVNNIKWFVLDKDQSKLPKGKAQVARLVLDKYTHSPLEQAIALNAVYGSDYPELGAAELGQRLKRVSELLSAAADRPKKEMIVEEIVANLQWRMEQVGESVLEQMVADGGRAQVLPGNHWGDLGRLDARIGRMLGFYSDRLVTRRKMLEIGSAEVQFERRDFDILAREFDMSPLQVREIVGLLKSCFNANGRFTRPGFEECAEAFARHENKVFEILWHYVKQPLAREDRLAFLNALQLYFIKLKQPEKALEVLLDDFLSSPKEIRFSDRNAMMLGNLLLRRYNKEIEIEIEITPEEVFLVREGLNREAAAAALRMVDNRRESFFEKIRGIHRRLIEALEMTQNEAVEEMGLKYFLSLEREIHIFVSLLGGDLARSVLRSALNEYGFADSELYRLAGSQSAIEALMQHLKVLLRGLGRAGDPADIPVLDQIIGERDAFLLMNRDDRHSTVVNRVMEWAARIKSELQGRLVAETA